MHTQHRRSRLVRTIPQLMLAIALSSGSPQATMAEKPADFTAPQLPVGQGGVVADPRGSDTVDLITCLPRVRTTHSSGGRTVSEAAHRQANGTERSRPANTPLCWMSNGWPFRTWAR